MTDEALRLTPQEASILVTYFEVNGSRLPAIGAVGSALLVRLEQALDAPGPRLPTPTECRVATAALRDLKRARS
jgi:hypothetical protein